MSDHELSREDQIKAERTALRIIMSRTMDGIHPGIRVTENTNYRLADAALDLYAKMTWPEPVQNTNSPHENKPERNQNVSVSV